MIQTIRRRVRRDSGRHLADLWMLGRYPSYFRTILIFPASSGAINSQRAEVLQKVILSHATLTLSYLSKHAGTSEVYLCRSTRLFQEAAGFLLFTAA